MRNLGLVWTSHLKTEAEKKEFEGTVRNSWMVLERLRKILEDRIEALDTAELSDDFYSSPDVTQKLIFNNGRKRELKDALRLLAFMD